MVVISTELANQPGAPYRNNIIQCAMAARIAAKLSNRKFGVFIAPPG